MIPQTSTQITYPSGATQARSTIEDVVQKPGNNHAIGIVTKVTCMHPRDFRWPDQPADRGSLLINGKLVSVTDTVKARVIEGGYQIDKDITLQRGKESSEATLVVIHCLDEMIDARTGDNVDISVDQDYRFSISSGHSASHLLTLGLNEVLSDFWKKVPRIDENGFPAFTEMTLVKSEISEFACQDTFRIGKSLKKKGFDAELLWQSLPEIEMKLNEFIDNIVSDNSAKVLMRPSECSINEHRKWHLDANRSYTKSCGGTHLTNFSQISHMRVALSQGDQVLIAKSVVTPK